MPKRDRNVKMINSVGEEETVEKSRSLVLFHVDGLRPGGLLHADTLYVDGLMKSGAYTFAS